MFDKQKFFTTKFMEITLKTATPKKLKHCNSASAFLVCNAEASKGAYAPQPQHKRFKSCETVREPAW